MVTSAAALRPYITAEVHQRLAAEREAPIEPRPARAAHVGQHRYEGPAVTLPGVAIVSSVAQSIGSFFTRHEASVSSALIGAAMFSSVAGVWPVATTPPQTDAAQRREAP